MKRVIFALAAILAACSPKAEEPAAAPAAATADKDDAGIPLTPNNPFFGTWTVSSSVVAPWWNGQGEAPVASADFAAKPVVLAAAGSSGPELTTCAKPMFKTNTADPRGLFQGNLTDPASQAAALGLASDSILVLSYSCSENQRDIALDFAMADDSTILLGLDNMIYTLKRAN